MGLGERGGSDGRTTTGEALLSRSTSSSWSGYLDLTVGRIVAGADSSVGAFRASGFILVVVFSSFPLFFFASLSLVSSLLLPPECTCFCISLQADFRFLSVSAVNFDWVTTE